MNAARIITDFIDSILVKGGSATINGKLVTGLLSKEIIKKLETIYIIVEESWYLYDILAKGNSPLYPIVLVTTEQTAKQENMREIDLLIHYTPNQWANQSQFNLFPVVDSIKGLLWSPKKNRLRFFLLQKYRHSVYRVHLVFTLSHWHEISFLI